MAQRSKFVLPGLLFLAIHASATTVGPVEAVSAYRNPSLNVCAGVAR